MRQLDGAGVHGSRWWTDICSLEQSNGEFEDRWFSDAITKKIRDGGDTSFRYDSWLPGRPLKDHFNRLFRAAEHKEVWLRDQGWWDSEGAWHWGWLWRTPLFSWEEEMLSQLHNLLGAVSLDQSTKDKWVWLEDPSGEYTAKSGYRLLPYTTSQQDPFFFSVLGNVCTPKGGVICVEGCFGLSSYFG